MATPHGSYREAPPRPGPARPPIKLVSCIAVGCLGLAAFTSNKLWTMAKLRGDIEGIEQREMTVGRELHRFGKSNAAVYRLRDAQDGEWKIQFNDASLRSHTGETIKVRCVERSRDCYSRKSVYIHDGNRDFDFMLLAIELSGLIASLVLMQRRIAGWRQAKRLVAPPRAVTS